MPHMALCSLNQLQYLNNNRLSLSRRRVFFNYAS